MPGHLPSELHRRAAVDRRSIRGRLQNGEQITQAAHVGARRLYSVKVDEQSDGTRRRESSTTCRYWLLSIPEALESCDMLICLRDNLRQYSTVSVQDLI